MDCDEWIYNTVILLDVKQLLADDLCYRGVIRRDREVMFACLFVS